MIQITNKANFTEILIYDEIGLFGITADDFAKEIEAKHEDGTPLHVRILSGGGSVFDGIAIYNTLNRIGNVTVFIDGIAASIASYIAMAGDKIIMADNAQMMIHNVQTIAIGEAEDLKREAKLMDSMNATLAKAYAAKTGKTTEEIGAFMDAETWFTATEAKELGLVDEIGVGMELAANAGGFGRHDFRNYAALGGEKIGQPKAKNNEKGAQIMSASLKELKAACPGATNDFLVTQLEKEATTEGASQAHMAAQAAELEASKQATVDAEAAQKTAEDATAAAEAKAGETKTTKPSGSKALGSGANGTNAEANASDAVDPIAQFDTLVREKMLAGMTGSGARKAVARQDPELQTAFLSATNGGVKILR